MRFIPRCLIAFILVLATAAYGQKGLYTGMTAEAFRTQLPGVLPVEFVYNDDLHLKEKLYSIEGEWSFVIHSNALSSAVFNSECRLADETGFNEWIKSAESVFSDYAKAYGDPVSNEYGKPVYTDRNNEDYLKSTGRREVFREAVWETQNMRIKISCDYRSNYYEEFREGIPNGPHEWYYYSFRIAFSSLPYNSGRQADMAGRFYLGMDVSAFAKVFPELFPGGIGLTGQWSREEVIHGLDGGWAYTFKNGRLDWMIWDKYIDDINEANFNICLAATRAMIKDYTLLYGTPDTTITGNTHFVDPAQKRHWGYDVTGARWKNYKGMKIKVEFTFMGGKGDYHLLVKSTFFDKDYPYFD